MKYVTSLSFKTTRNIRLIVSLYYSRDFGQPMRNVINHGAPTYITAIKARLDIKSPSSGSNKHQTSENLTLLLDISPLKGLV